MRAKRIVVLGDGGWGTTLAILLFNKGLDVALWSAFPAYAKRLDRTRRNPYYLKGVAIPRGITVTSDPGVLRSADVIVVAVPSEYLRRVLRRTRGHVPASSAVVSVVKGIEFKTLKRMSEVIREVWGIKRLAVLSGPTIAAEVARGVPSTAAISSHDEVLMADMQALFMTSAFRVYANPDVPGVELGGSLKNIIAIACGISDGLGFGTNTKAAIVSRGLAEMGRLGVAMGARRETFAGVAGLGDLVTTCFSGLSRNHFVGEAIGEGRKLKAVIGRMKMVAEGVPTTRSAHRLASKYGIEMPITQAIYGVLFEGKSPRRAVEELMTRRRKRE